MELIEKLNDKNKIENKLNNFNKRNVIKNNFLVFVLMSIPLIILSSMVTSMFSLIFNNNYKILTTIFIITYLLFIYLFFKLIYLMEKSSINYDLKALKKQLNKPFVDINDNEKVYLLYELIEKYGLKKLKNNKNNDDIYQYVLINTNEEYKEFNDMAYTDSDLENILKNKIIPQKELNDQQVSQFYDKKIIPCLNKNKKSFEEKEVLLKRVINKNKVNLL